MPWYYAFEAFVWQGEGHTRATARRLNMDPIQIGTALCSTNCPAATGSLFWQRCRALNQSVVLNTRYIVSLVVASCFVQQFFCLRTAAAAASAAAQQNLPENLPFQLDNTVHVFFSVGGSPKKTCVFVFRTVGFICERDVLASRAGAVATRYEV